MAGSRSSTGTVVQLSVLSWERQLEVSGPRESVDVTVEVRLPVRTHIVHTIAVIAVFFSHGALRVAPRPTSVSRDCVDSYTIESSTARRFLVFLARRESGV